MSDVVSCLGLERVWYVGLGFIGCFPWESQLIRLEMKTVPVSCLKPYTDERKRGWRVWGVCTFVTILSPDNLIWISRLIVGGGQGVGRSNMM